ncbi:type IV secretion system DNA-binding domain-containing protein [Bradyrhizobium sp. 200]|uniref:type IV secretory system conjugative DNA transfer family protein n=1 Tax=Bradyrhizobium sp. 200 TaxID=2782665 RepID=UPI001FFE8166|nr:type IV secretion system DNA-binding domain-containing protein [Bradyrhizobium sp. 200]
MRERVLRSHPALRPSPIVGVDRGAVVLGRAVAGTPVSLSVRARLEHMHVVGTTGGGKTRLIQHCACQDIAQGRGVCIIDPHGNHEGSMYRSMLAWLARRPFLKDRTVHLIDPNVGSHVIGFNPLALPSAEYDPTVIAEAMQQALERVWGEEDMNTKPTMQRVLSTILTTLTELNLTIAEASLLFDPSDQNGVRAWAIRNLANEEARDELEWLHAIGSEARGHQDFRQEVTGPRNRLSKLTRSQAVKLTVSQDVNGIDFRAALDEGHIILANLSPGPLAGDKAVEMLGRLLTRSIFFHTVRRRRPDRPFFLYLDECQLYLSGDVSRMLAEARKYGTGVVLAHQTLSQLRAAGEDVLDAVKSTTNIKVVTRIKDPAEAAELADMVVRHNLEMPVSVLTKPTLIGHELVRRQSGSDTWQEGIAESKARTSGQSVTESESFTESVSDTVSDSYGTAESESWGTSDSVSSSQSETDAYGTSTAINLVPGTIGSPAAASGNTIGESAGTYSNMGWASPSRYVIGDARMEAAIVAGVGIGESRQRSSGNSHSSQSGMNRSNGITTSRQRGTARTNGSAWTNGVAYTTSESTTHSLSHSRGRGGSQGWSEALEPILADRPTSVHSLDNVRYMAGEVLRNFAAGFAAISLVDGDGLKTAVLKTARVADCKLTSEQFDTLRHEFLQRSPSAVPIETALASLATRQSRLLQRAGQLRDAEPEAPEQFRTKRTRKEPETSVDAHGDKSPPEPPPVKGPDRRRRRP